jgi:hypothetical protein
MIRLKKWHWGKDNSFRRYAACCDSKGRSGYWSCENLGPESGSRVAAGENAKAAGWLVARGKWFCPDCQRDGFVPTSTRQLQTLVG